MQVDAEQSLVWTPRRSEGTTTSFSEDTWSSETNFKRR